MSNLKFDQLSRIKIDGYKSIINCDLELKKINVLIGSNGAGKSNFISVFNFSRTIISRKLAMGVNLAGGANSLLFKGRKITDKIEMEFFFGQNAYSFELIPTDDDRLIFDKEFFNYYADNRNVNKSVNIGSGQSESLWEKGVGSGFIDKYIKPILKDVKWRVYHFHDTGKDATVKQAHNISNNIELGYNAGNLAAFLYRLKQKHIDTYQEIINSVKLIAPYFDDFYLEPNEGNEDKIILKWKQNGCDDIFNASQLSDGTLRFICLTTLLLQPKDLQPATIIIDEPELGLHPYAITIFAEMVKQISENKQVIISTQSVELLNEFDLEDVVIVDRDDDGSVFKRLDSEELKDWLENEYSLGELWNKNILGGRLSK